MNVSKRLKAELKVRQIITGNYCLCRHQTFVSWREGKKKTFSYHTFHHNFKGRHNSKQSSVPLFHINRQKLSRPGSVPTCWSATKSKCLFYLTKFQIKPFQLYMTEMRLFVSIGAKSTLLHTYIFHIRRSSSMRGTRITYYNTKGGIMNSPEKRRGSRYELHA